MMKCANENAHAKKNMIWLAEAINTKNS